MRKLLLALLTVVSVQPVLGWNVTEDFQKGFYWSSLPVSMTVIDSDSNRMQLMKALVDDAVTSWEGTVVSNLWTMSAQQVNSAGGNIIRWSNNFAAETGLSPQSVLAVTVRYTGGPYIARAEIIINGNNAINSSETNLRKVILHELGHTLGLDHSQYSNAIMASSISFNASSLHSDDRSGMQDVVNQTLQRQATGYISPLASYEESESQSPLNCGTVDMGGGSNGGGPGNGLFSLALGFLITLIALAKTSKKQTAKVRL